MRITPTTMAMWRDPGLENARPAANVSDATKDTFEKLFRRINATLANSSHRAARNPAIAIFAQQLADGTITQKEYDEIIRSLGAG